MAVSRRAVGLGLLATSAVATGGLIYGRSNPMIRGLLGDETKLSGFIGGEKERFITNPAVIAALRRQGGFVLDARRAGSVEMARERALLDQRPAFLWPASSILVDLVRESGVNILRDRVILNSPMVVYGWDLVANGLVASGFAKQQGELRYSLDLLKLLEAIVQTKSWSDIGVSSIFGNARLLSTDANRSNSGFMFAGLAANLLAGEVVTPETLPKVSPRLRTIFARMGYKPSSSGKMFEDYLAGGPGAQPLIVGYENQLVEWVLEDKARWQRLEASAPAKPVLLYPTPTVLSAHPLISIDAKADPLIEALLSRELQEIAWTQHGFRGPLGVQTDIDSPAVRARLLPRVDAVVPMPDIRTMLALIDQLAA